MMADADGRERELKLKVPDRAALDAIARAAGGPPARAVRQVNHFFDTADRDLDRAHMALRLRDQDGRHFVTAKGPADVADGAFTSRAEEECEIGAAEARRLLAGTLAPLAPLADRPLAAALALGARGKALVLLGSFENLRTRVPWRFDVAGDAVDVALELDETTFPGGRVEYEVELEIPRGVEAAIAERALRALLASAGVEGIPAAPKLKRFLAFLP